MRLAWHPYLAPTLVQSDLTRPMSLDAFGHKLHLIFALLFCFLLPWPTSIIQFAGIPLIIFFLLRTPNIWRTWGSFSVQPLFLAVVAFIAWQAITLAWTPDTRQGFRELTSNRWLWAMWMLWPVMMPRHLLIAALIAGFFCGNLSQLGHALGQSMGIDWLTWPRLPDRNSGWWPPVVGGSLLVGALGLHLPAAAMGRGRWRLLGLAGASITLLAIFATGSRGAWIAAAALVAIVACIAIGRSILARRSSEPRHTRFSPILALSTLVLLTGIVGWMAVGDSMVRRIAEARQEVERAAEGDYQTYTGARILMAQWAATAAVQHPAGVGLGGYRAWTHEQLAARGESHMTDHIHSHAHNSLLHIAASLGVVGLLLAISITALALRGGFAHLNLVHGGLGTYAAGPAFALLGLLLVSAFDVVHLNGQTTPLLAVLFSMCLISRPTVPIPSLHPPTLPAAAEASTIAPNIASTDPLEGVSTCPESVPSATNRSTP